ncbi:hypothetical protein ACN9OH_04150 [Glaesserella parasuis]|uniref:hypothetical protein n=1 Tax=Glaesserella parasuis TaxID=738 RepID=UPI003B67064E
MIIRSENKLINNFPKNIIVQIQRYLEKAPKTVLNPPQLRDLNIIADTTFFGRQKKMFITG